MPQLPGVSPSGAANQIGSQPVVSTPAPTPSVVPPAPTPAPTPTEQPAEVTQEVVGLPSEKELSKKKTYKIAGIILAILILGVTIASIVLKNTQDNRKEATTCVEQCPGNDGVLRSCTPPESDGSSNDSTCNVAGRIEPCGGRNYCCPSAGGAWTTTMTACATPTVTLSPSLTATPSATLTLSPTATPSATVTATPSATITVSVTATPSATVTVSITATPSATITATATPTGTTTPTGTKTPTPTGTKTPTPTPTPTITPTATPTISSNTLPASGSVETTFLLLIASFFSIALGMAIKYKN